METLTSSAVSEYRFVTAELAGHSVNIVSYRLRNLYICGIDNLEPGATICRATGKTRKEAMAKAIEDAVRILKRQVFLSMGTPESRDLLKSVVVTSDAGETMFSPGEFVCLPAQERMGYLMKGQAKYLDSRGVEIPAGDAMRMLKSVAEKEIDREYVVRN